MKKSELRQLILEVKQEMNEKDVKNINNMKLYNTYNNLLKKINESVIDPKNDAKLSKDLRKDSKSLTAFINKNYHKIMSMCGDKNKLKKFFQDNFFKMSISDKTIRKVEYNLDKINNKNSLQKYLTNILLKGSGQGMRENKENFVGDIRNLKKVINIKKIKEN